jgi:hypothetical protein
MKKGGQNRPQCIRRDGVLGCGGVTRTDTGDLSLTPVRVISKETFMPYGITEVEESVDGSGFNIRDLTTNKPAVHFA